MSCEASTTAPAVHIGDLLLTLDIEVHLQVRTASAFLLQLDTSPYLTPIPQPFAILGIPSLSQSPIQQSLNPKRSCKFLDLPKPQVSFPATILLGVLIFRPFPQTKFGVPALPQNCEFLPPPGPIEGEFPCRRTPVSTRPPDPAYKARDLVHVSGFYLFSPNSTLFFAFALRQQTSTAEKLS